MNCLKLCLMMTLFATMGLAQNAVDFDMEKSRQLGKTDRLDLNDQRLLFLKNQISGQSKRLIKVEGNVSELQNAKEIIELRKKLKALESKVDGLSKELKKGRSLLKKAD